ncbi:hypothetical protein ARALYDRAFT_342120 [Arabidopsis lyrata subsp. lyrata]|uniref:Uncharacterized protein n=1 Tax=Arabidopsis lyrata subsp. lyrata TaxID=81972 RepID=D7LA40_ARALL|nr:hypothetical protein ARALYDRAFT_342120 [Arabidopsis lyrata subsp. lyrata]
METFWGSHNAASELNPRQGCGTCILSIFCSQAGAKRGFAFRFDVEFSGPASSPANTTSETSVASGSSSISPSGEVNQKKRTNPSDALVLSTSPEAPPTHWQQFYFSVKNLNW